jgi:hypothetical protein
LEIKTIKIGEFFDRVHERLEAAGSNVETISFFKIFLQNSLVDESLRSGWAQSGWDRLGLAAGDFDVLYPKAAEMLRDAASRNYSEAHPDTYEVADAISKALCEELNTFFEFTGKEVFDPIPIRSFIDTMVDEGLIAVEDGLIKLTPKGEAMAYSVGCERPKS